MKVRYLCACIEMHVSVYAYTYVHPILFPENSIHFSPIFLPFVKAMAVTPGLSLSGDQLKCFVCSQINEEFAPKMCLRNANDLVDICFCATSKW